MRIKFIPSIIKNIEIPKDTITEILKKLEIGDGFDFPAAARYSSFHVIAKRIGIKIRTKRNRLWRIE